MGDRWDRRPAPERLVGIVVAALALLLAPLASAAVPHQVDGGTPVLGESLLDADQIEAWYEGLGITPRSPTSVRQLAELFLDEGGAQGVRGDIAFAQSMLETGYLRFGGQVRPSDHNFSGLGACDACPRGLAFDDPQLGVRAQIQHLYAYAAPDASPEGLARPLADIRFDLVQPRGRAASWEQMGDGNWATDRGYADKVLGIWRAMLSSAGVEEPATIAPTLRVLAASGGGARLAGWALRRHPLAVGQRRLGAPTSRRVARGGCLVRWPELRAAALLVDEAETCQGDEGSVRWARVAGSRWQTQRGLAPGDALSRLRELYPRTRRRGGRWWLVSGRDPGSSRRVARLSAEVRGGKVRALWVSVPRAVAG